MNKTQLQMEKWLLFGGNMKKVILSIDGMTCAACSSGLEKYLNKQDGIKNASVNLVMSNASIEYDDSIENLLCH